MGFFFTENKAEAKPKAPKKVRVQDIPVQSLQKLGCSVCPRDKDEGNLRSPKMRASGPKSAAVYLLGSAPSEEDDENDNHWTDKAGDALREMFGDGFMRADARSNYVTQCRGDQTPVEVECCRPRIVADIEECRPEIVVTVGDAPFQWATGFGAGSGSAPLNRGELFVTRIGNHACYVYCLVYPNYVHRDWFKKGEWQLALEHDVARLKGLVGMLPPPRVYDAPYDAGVEVIRGDGPGDFHRLEDALNEIARFPRSAVDIETNGLRPYMLRDPRILTCAVGTFGRTLAFTVDHPHEGWGTDRRRAEVKGLLADYLMQSGRKAAHNLSMELEWFAHAFGNRVLRRTEWDDTMAMAHTLDERPGTKSLDYQCRKHFGFFLKQLSNMDTKRMLDYPLGAVLKYNGMDCKWTDLLRDTLAPLVREENQAEYDRKVRLAPTLVATEAVGLLVDREYATAQVGRINANIKDVEARLKRQPEIKRYEQRLGTFDPANAGHVLKLYRDVEPRPEIKVEDPKTGAVRWTTEEDQLAKIELPSAALILEHRGASKLVGTYIEPVISGKIVCRDGRMRSKYSSMTAITGRLASEDPALQNWPVRKFKEIRGIVRAFRGGWMVPFDYGQIEFRVIGMASGDQNLVKYAWTGYDVHGYWAQRVIDEYGPVKDYIWNTFHDTITALLKKDPDEDKAILKTLRQEAKNGWVFPLYFGSSPKSCARNLHIPEEVAADLAAEFWDEFRGVRKWQDRLLAAYEKNLYVETLGGRKRRGAMTRNEIINLPIQGTAFDIVGEAMNAISELADETGDDELIPALNVHDDLTFYLDDASMEGKIPVIAREMCMPRFDFINVPLIVEVKAGRRWNEVQEIKVYRSDELFGTRNPYK